jgi:hypothetical protein
MSVHGFNLPEFLETALRNLPGQVPMMLAYVVALIVVITRWRQAPRASMLALCGVLFGLFLLTLSPFVYAWLAQKVNSGGASSTEVMSMYFIAGVGISFCHAISFGFLFLAIYADRRSPMAPPPPPGY